MDAPRHKARHVLCLELRQLRNRLRHTVLATGGTLQGCDVPLAYTSQTGRDWRTDVAAAGVVALRGGLLRAVATALPDTFRFSTDTGSGKLAVHEFAIPDVCPHAQWGQCKWGDACDMDHTALLRGAPHAKPAAVLSRAHGARYPHAGVPGVPYPASVGMAAAPAVAGPGDISKYARRLTNRIRHTLQHSSSVADCSLWLAELGDEYSRLTGRDIPGDAHQAGLPSSSVFDAVSALCDAGVASFGLVEDGGHLFVTLHDGALPPLCSKEKRGECTWGSACDYTHASDDLIPAPTPDTAASWRGGAPQRRGSFEQRFDMTHRAAATAPTGCPDVVPGTCRVPGCTYSHAKHACFKCKTDDADHRAKDCPGVAAKPSVAEAGAGAGAGAGARGAAVPARAAAAAPTRAVVSAAAAEPAVARETGEPRSYLAPCAPLPVAAAAAPATTVAPATTATPATTAAPQPRVDDAALIAAMMALPPSVWESLKALPEDRREVAMQMLARRATSPSSSA